ncbi:MAG: ABC transporter permease [Armatimonadota bacterium]
MTQFQQVLTIAHKELREIATNRGLLFSGIFFTAWFSVMTGLGVGGDQITRQAQLNNTLFYMGALIGLFVGYIYSGQTYLREKQTGIVETLLCAPVSLRSIWIGKALGVALPSYIMSLLAAVLITLIAGQRAAQTLMPGATVVFHLLAVVPLFVVAAVSMLGFAQLMLGMRENMVVNMVTIMVLFGALAGTRLIVENAEFVTWTAVAVLAGSSLVLLLITTLLGRYLSRERIVRTIS